MRLSYHHVNPSGGNESFLLRYSADGERGASCVLVDAGANADLDNILRPTDDLEAICLTHAHLDHYQSLERCRSDGTPVYASSATASILGNVFDVATRQYDVDTTESTADAVEPIEGWVELAPGLSVHPIPAGHVPGAVGFLFRAVDGEKTYHILATGDFTHRRAAGFPGLAAEEYLDVDVVFLTVATSTTFEANLSEGLARALHRAHAGSTTLVATSGLFGVQVAYLLSALGEEYDREVPILLVGQVAKLYEALDYDCPHVETVPVFEDPRACLDRGTISIAGPEVPHERSSGRLFDVLRDDPSATVIQLIGSGEDVLREGTCTTHGYEVVNHPTREQIDDVHDALDPIHTVAVHRHRGAGEGFNDLDSIVWSPTDSDEYTLYDDGWLSPPWMSVNRSFNEEGTSTRNFQQFADEIVEQLSLPPLTRHDTPDLTAEGIHLDLVEDRLSQVTAYEEQPDPEIADNEPVAADQAPATPDTPMTANDDQNTENESPDTPPASSGLHDTTRVNIEGIDPWISEGIESGKLDPAEVAETVRTAKTAESIDRTQNESEESDSESSEPSEEADDDEEPSRSVEQDEQEDSEPEHHNENVERSDEDDDARTAAEGEGITVSLPPLAGALVGAAVLRGDAESPEDLCDAALTAYMVGLLDGSIDASTQPPAVGIVDENERLGRAIAQLMKDERSRGNTTDLIGEAVAEGLPGDGVSSVTFAADDPNVSLIDAVVDGDRVGLDSRSDVLAVSILEWIVDQ